MGRTIVVIGGGPAAVEAAVAAGQAGASVTLVSDGPIGGRAGWDSLVPSKVWLAAADLLGELHAAEVLGLAPLPPARVAPQAVLARIRAVAQSWSDQALQRLSAAGVTRISGVASFSGPHSLTVSAEGQPPTTLAADAIIIATGSVPRFPPGLRPDGKRVLAPRFASSLDTLPADIIVVGGGATGCEFTSLFTRLGVPVTWLVGDPRVLPQFAPAAGAHLAQALVDAGVALHTAAMVERIEPEQAGVAVITSDGARYRAAMAFLAIGRRPDLARLNLEAAGLPTNPDGTLTVDSYGQSGVPGIYAVGDAAGAPMLANRAMAQAWIAGRHAAGLTVEPYRPEAIIHAVYSDPEVAQLGSLEGLPATLQRVRVPYAAGLKGHLSPGAGAGWVELSYEPASGQIRGALAVGAHAADVLAPVALAVQLGAGLAHLAPVFAAHPALSELAFIAARAALERG